MEIRLLKYFVAIVDCGNITKAAEQLHITQPTLSRQLNQLEADLGVNLFHRNHKILSLTEEGLLFKRRAEEILSLVSLTENEMNQKNEKLIGTIGIGSGETTGIKELALLMKTFNEKHENVKFDIFSGTADDIDEKLEKGLLDMGLMTEPVDTSRYNYIRLNNKDTWGIIVRKDHELASYDFIEPDQLIGENIMFSKRKLVQKEFDAWLGKYKDKINYIATYNLIYNVKQLVHSGLGIAIGISGLIDDYEDNEIRFIPLKPEIKMGCVLVWKKDRYKSKTVDTFINDVLERKD